MQLHADQPIYVETLPPTHRKKNRQENISIPNNGAASIGQKVTSQQKLRFLDTGEMCPITDIYRHNSPHTL